MAVEYYLELDGVHGDDVPGRIGKLTSWAGDFTYGPDQKQPLLEDLTFQFESDAGLADLLSLTLSGKLLRSAAVVGYERDTSSGTLAVVDTMKLGESRIIGLSDQAYEGFTLKLAPSQVGFKSVTPDSKDKADVHDFAWEFDTRTEIAYADMKLPVGDGIASVSDRSLDYYIAIDGMDGDVRLDGYQGYMKLGDAMKLGFEQFFSGKVDFQPFEVALETDTWIPQLLTNMVTGKLIDAVEIIGLDNTQDVVYQLNLNDVIVTDVDTGSGTDTLTLDYGKIYMAQFDSQGIKVSDAGWNRALNETIEGGLSEPTVAARPQPFETADRYFMIVDGIAGDVERGTLDATDRDLTGWIELTDFDLEASNGGSFGEHPGWKGFSGTTLTEAGLADLVGLMRDGKLATVVEVVAIASQSKAPVVTERFVFEDVRISGATDIAPGGYTFQAEMAKVGMESLVRAQEFGDAVPFKSFGWDIVENKIINLPGGLEGTFGGVTPGNTPAETYYLRIDGIDGSSASKLHEGDTLITSLNWKAEAPAARSGKFVPGTLTLEGELGGLMPDLMTSASTGSTFKSIEVESFSLIDTDELAGTLYVLNQARVIDLTLRGDGPDSVTFDLGSAFGVSQPRYEDMLDATPDSTDTFAHDLQQNQSVAFDKLDRVSGTEGFVGTQPDPDFVDSYVRIDGLNGVLYPNAKQESGLLALDWYDLEVAAAVPGRPEFGSLRLGFKDNTGLVELTELALSGAIVPGLQVLDIASDSDTFGETFLDSRFAEARVVSVDEMSGGGYEVAIDFSAISVDTVHRLPNGEAQPDREGFSYDLVTREPLSSGISVDPGKNNQPFPDNPDTDYYLYIDGIPGAADDADHKGWIEIVSMSSATRGDGRPLLNELDLVVDATGAYSRVMEKLIMGEELGPVEIVGITNERPTTAYKLEKVLVSSFQIGGAAGGEPGDRLTLTFDRIEITGTTAPVSGSFSTAVGWENSTNTLYDPLDVATLSDIDAATNAVLENSAPGTEVGITAFSTLGATYSLTQNPGGLFAIDAATGVVTLARSPDYEVIGGRVVLGIASFDGSQTVTGDFAVGIVDVPGQTLKGTTGPDKLFGGPEGDAAYGDTGDDLIATYAGNDTVYAGGGHDEVWTFDGNDSVFGGYGSDTIRTGNGDDYVAGGPGRDMILTGDGEDTVAGGSGSDIVDLGRGDDTFIEDPRSVFGSNDVVYGRYGADLVRSGGGDDSVYGQNGRDSIYAGFGDDYIEAGAHADLVAAGAGNDTVLGQGGPDTVYLSDGDDLFLDDASAGDDTVFGGNGRDRIELMGGNDKVVGGSEADTFVFVGEMAHDMVTDFEVKVDLLRLDESIWGGRLDLDEVMARFGSVVGGDVILTFDKENSIHLVDGQSLDLVASTTELF